MGSSKGKKNGKGSSSSVGGKNRSSYNNYSNNSYDDYQSSPSPQDQEYAATCASGLFNNPDHSFNQAGGGLMQFNNQAAAGGTWWQLNEQTNSWTTANMWNRADNVAAGAAPAMNFPMAMNNVSTSGYTSAEQLRIQNEALHMQNHRLLVELNQQQHVSAGAAATMRQQRSDHFSNYDQSSADQHMMMSNSYTSPQDQKNKRRSAPEQHQSSNYRNNRKYGSANDAEQHQRDNKNNKGRGRNNNKGEQNGSSTNGQHENNGNHAKGGNKRKQASNSSATSVSTSKKEDTVDEDQEYPIDPKASQFLRDFREGKINVESLSDIKEHTVEFCGDQIGARFVQDKLEEASEQEKALVLSVILPAQRDLTFNMFGNYVVQKLFEVCNAAQIKRLAEQLTGEVFTLSLNNFGCRVIQKAFEVCELEQKMLLVSELRGHERVCIQDQHGNHVIQKMIQYFPTTQLQPIVNVVLTDIEVLSSHAFGCRVLQRLLEHGSDAQKDEILAALRPHVVNLIEGRFSNYVVQHMLEHGKKVDREVVLSVVRSNLPDIGMHKFGSNVVEKALETEYVEERRELVGAMIGNASDQTPPMLAMMTDKFGNFIVQRLIDIADDDFRTQALERLRHNADVLKKFCYGRHVLAHLKRLELAQREEEASTSAQRPQVVQ